MKKIIPISVFISVLILLVVGGGYVGFKKLTAQKLGGGFSTWTAPFTNFSEASLTTTNNTPTTVFSYTLPATSTAMVTVFGSGNGVTTTQGIGFSCQQAFKNDAVGVSSVGSGGCELFATDPTWNAVFVTTSVGFNFQVTGTSTGNIKWITQYAPVITTQ